MPRTRVGFTAAVEIATRYRMSSPRLTADSMGQYWRQRSAAAALSVRPLTTSRSESIFSGLILTKMAFVKSLYRTVPSC
jgi:hypothetical protein